MLRLTYENAAGDFRLEGSDLAGEMVFPLVNAAGMISSVTPRLAGDAKTGQNSFLLPPASVETLHESRATRNFFLRFPDGFLWSAAGVSAPQQAALYQEREEAAVRGGLLWHEVSRRCPDRPVRAAVLSFVPADGPAVELARVTLKNTGDKPVSFVPTAAFPLYGRSADNIRDHRHVTSLLNRLTVTEDGVCLRPAMTFDERGHRPGENRYTVCARSARGEAPVRFLGPVQDYVGAGSWDWPQALLCPEAPWMRTGDTAAGYEMAAALQFPETVLAPGEEISYYIALGVNAEGREYLSPAAFDSALERTKAHWQRVGAAAFETGDPGTDAALRWAAVQPELRRICGCSFLPHHDYGRGGRGWRDLWQDSLALLLRSPAAVRQDLCRYFAGVRADGTNATIIGAAPGEFLADRNNIVRVWMDHGYWPLVTVNEYLRQTGDLSLLLEKQPWFWDRRKMRGEALAEEMPPSTRLQIGGKTVESTVLEHLLVQSVTAFFDIGDHGCIRLRGADWNDALDMAADRGESVAFTAAYAGNLFTLADLCEQMRASGAEADVSAALDALLRTPPQQYGDPAACRAVRRIFEAACETDGGRRPLDWGFAARTLRGMGESLVGRLRENEFIRDGDRVWMNSYYDNAGEAVEGRKGSAVRMMLTGQVFSLMSGAAEKKAVDGMIRAADGYLYDEKRGGYCLNTDFGADIPPLGRQFGFAWGHKENGAVFCHMAVMYAYALYRRGKPEAAWKALSALLRQSMDTPVSRIYPGVPEYFDPRGRGMYPYLTGAGSWLMLTLITQLFGVQGDQGDLVLRPQLLPGHFGEKQTAVVRCFFAEKEWEIVFRRPGAESWARLTAEKAVLDGREYPGGRIPRGALTAASSGRIDVFLKGE